MTFLIPTFFILFFVLSKLFVFINKNKSKNQMYQICLQNIEFKLKKTTTTKKAKKKIDSKFNNILNQSKHISHINKLIYDTFKETDINLGSIIIINLMIILFCLCISLITNLKFILLLFSLVFFEILYFYYLYQKNKVDKTITQHLPQILDFMAKIYKVNPDLKLTLQQTTQYIKHPYLKEKFSEMVKLTNYGFSALQAMEKVSKSLNSSDFNFIVNSIKLNQPIGGNLPKLLNKTSQTLRKRKSTKKQISTLMFQNRISSIIASLMVPIVAILALTFSENYQTIVFSNPNIRLIFLIAGIWWLIGVFIINKTTKIKI